MLMHGHGAARQGATPTHGFDLQVQILKAHGVVAIHGTLPWQAEYVIQIGFPVGHEGAPRLLRRHLKTAIEVGHVMLAQDAIGSLQGGAQNRRPCAP